MKFCACSVRDAMHYKDNATQPPACTINRFPKEPHRQYKALKMNLFNPFLEGKKKRFKCTDDDQVG